MNITKTRSQLWLTFLGINRSEQLNAEMKLRPLEGCSGLVRGPSSKHIGIRSILAPHGESTVSTLALSSRNQNPRFQAPEDDLVGKKFNWSSVAPIIRARGDKI